jgi:hypothetical protein
VYGRWEQIPPIAKSSVFLLFLLYARYVCQLMEVTCNECTLYTAVGGGKLEWGRNCVCEKVHNTVVLINWWIVAALRTRALRLPAFFVLVTRQMGRYVTPPHRCFFVPQGYLREVIGVSQRQGDRVNKAFLP